VRIHIVSEPTIGHSTQHSPTLLSAAAGSDGFVTSSGDSTSRSKRTFRLKRNFGWPIMALVSE
jgi:hypothetical protein